MQVGGVVEDVVDDEVEVDVDAVVLVDDEVEVLEVELVLVDDEVEVDVDSVVLVDDEVEVLEVELVLVDDEVEVVVVAGQATSVPDASTYA